MRNTLDHGTQLESGSAHAFLISGKLGTQACIFVGKCIQPDGYRVQRGLKFVNRRFHGQTISSCGIVCSRICRECQMTRREMSIKRLVLN